MSKTRAEVHEIIESEQSIREKISGTYYLNTKKYPTSMTIHKKEIEADVKENFVGTYHQMMKEIADRTAGVDAEYRRQMAEYHAEDSRLHELFKAEMFEEFGVTGNPKAEKCCSLAWEYGHSDGLMNVYNHFSELVELIR